MIKIQNSKLFTTFFIILSLITIFYKFSVIFNSTIKLLGSFVLILNLSYVLLNKLRILFTKANINVQSSKRTGAVLITGCDSGFGNRLAFKLNSIGYRVFATVLDPESTGAKYLVDNCLFKDKLRIIRMNVKKLVDICNAFEIIERELIENMESLWALVNNAGITHVGHVDWGQMQAYRNVVGVNTLGTVAITLKFLPLIRHSKGRIVNMSSINGRMAFQKTGHYSMSKFAMTAFSDGLRRQLCDWAVGVSTIEPAFYRTPLLADNNYKRVMDREWEQTATHVRQVYGQKYFDSMDAMAKGVDYFVGNNIDEVVDNIITAIIIPVPTETRYLTISGFILKFLIYLGERVPTEVFDTIYDIIERFQFGFEKIETNVLLKSHLKTKYKRKE